MRGYTNCFTVEKALTFWGNSPFRTISWQKETENVRVLDGVHINDFHDKMF